MLGCNGDKDRDEVLEMGDKDKNVVRKVLTGKWDRGIRSAICRPIE